MTAMDSIHPELQRVLLIEDDLVDVAIVKRAFSENALDYELLVHNTAESALRALENGEISTRGLLILLDLNLPRISGIKFLQKLRANPRLKRLPVVVLTTSNAEGDRMAAYEANVAGYLVKPADFDDCVAMVGRLAQYWNMVRLP